jgi:hypothetical protein
MALSDRITAVKPCPYKEGTKSAENFAKYREGMTVEEALSAGCLVITLPGTDATGT